ncbi:MAG: response regulator [Deltaproteobacteria bacterium]|nr:response regulator [Deltaproteobacteria bacterium]
MVLRTQPHILVIDDDDVARESAEVLLTRWGYRVSLADRGEMGLEALKADKPDLILVDLQMPGISGLEVLHQVQEIDPTIVCVMVTGYATLQSAVAAIKQGAYNFLPKPFSPDELRLVVERGLERRFLALETKALKDEKDRMEANFVTMVSHQMRSPITAVRQLLEVAVTEALGPLGDNYKDIVSRAVTRLDDHLASLNAWLNMSQIAEDGISQRKAKVDLVELLTTLADRVSLEVETAGQKLQMAEIPPGVSLEVDQENLLEALYNIASNAVKYNREGGAITIKALAAPHQVDISISDEGPGIPTAEQPFIFDDFFRSKSPELKKKPGTGLGLSITRRIVKAHQGEISLSSREGEGTTFTVSLPR